MRCAGFFATGGGAFDFPEVPDTCDVTDGRRACDGGGTGFRELMGMALGVVCAVGVPVWRRGGGGGGVSPLQVSCLGFGSSIKLTRAALAGSKGGGSFLGVVLEADVERSVEWLMCSYGELEMLEEKEPSRELARGTATQSGSSVGVKGFAGRLGLRMTAELPLAGGLGGETLDWAIFPCSSHHL